MRLTLNYFSYPSLIVAVEVTGSNRHGKGNLPPLLAGIGERHSQTKPLYNTAVDPDPDPGVQKYPKN
jgi:hypothetical protein